MSKTKLVDVIVRVRCPSWLTAAQARREIRSLINDQTHFGTIRPSKETSFALDDIGSDNFRALSVRALPNPR